MQKLPNNCRAGSFSVYPSNWQTAKADPKLIWRITYWFYDDNRQGRAKVIMKGLNHFSTAAEKRAAVQVIIKDELDLIQNQCYNHVTKSFPEETDIAGISEYTPFCKALGFAASMVKGAESTMSDLRSCLGYILKAATALQYDLKTVGEIKRKHLIVLLNRCGEIKRQTDIPIGKTGRTKKGKWTANTFNQYRANLSMLYRQLVKLDAVEANYVELIDREKSIKRIREELTKSQRKLVNEVIWKKDYYWWRLLHIFFHSGSREVEVLRLTFSDVDMDKERFKVLVKKGGLYQEEWRPIKTVVLHLWKEVMKEAKVGEYLFAEGLQPGKRDKPIRREQLTRRWRMHIKKPYGITADFYSLKHTNLDETAELLSIQDASKMAGHTSTVITMKHYTKGEKQRQNDRLKAVDNSFA